MQPSPLTAAPTIAQIQQRHEAIVSYIHRTPVLTAQSINDISGAELYFKCENFQKIGAFKMRGGISAALTLSKEELAKGIATHSSGNHAQAIAMSAKLLGVPAYIVMPNNSPKVKVKAVEGYGAQVTFSESTQASRESTLEKIIAANGAHFIHPYDNYDVICGQATCAKELIEDVPTILDAIIAPIGGGGLMSGTCLSTTYFSPQTKIYGGEPKAVDDAFRSLQSGTLQQNKTTNTIADGLKTNLSDKTFSIIKDHLTEAFTVEEEEIVAAMRLIWERMKIIIEPSCAVPLAVILKHRKVFEGKRVGVILTGGNVDLEQLPFTKN
ncbi:MAG: pyridoxal-phosphate dependent enzyme [Bacteroidota bacterium]